MKRWLLAEQDTINASRLARGLNVSPVVAGLLLSRGFADEESARRFLYPTEEQLHDPFLMMGMSEAVERVFQSIENREPILIYGDYDVDGTTGTVVLRRALKMLNAETGYHIPHRFTEGYGIQQPALERAKADGYKLVISVDCGIRAHEPLYWARENGLDVIVTDHHLPDEEEGAPPAFVVLNPNQRGCPYPDKNLAGVGVAFKLAQALFRKAGIESKIRGFIKMAAIGTVADVAKLVGENRAIVAIGLAGLKRAKNPGLKALIEVAGCGRGGLTAYDLGFRIGPRINAAGRMDRATAVIELFEAEDLEEARRLALLLDTHNKERQEVQQEIVDRALAELGWAHGARSSVAVLAGEGWHRGVIGIAASKIAERLNRPCVVISLDDELGHGSARSIDAYHLLDGLTECADLLEKFGGHSHAAGLLIRRDRIPELRRRLNEHASRLLGAEDLLPALKIDAELPPSAISLELEKELRIFEPYGAGNPRPVFATRELVLTGPSCIMKEKHLKFRVRGKDGPSFEAVWWDGLEESNRQTFKGGDRIELAYTLEANAWRGETRLQLCVKDARVTASGPSAPNAVL